MAMEGMRRGMSKGGKTGKGMDWAMEGMRKGMEKRGKTGKSAKEMMPSSPSMPMMTPKEHETCMGRDVQRTSPATLGPDKIGKVMREYQRGELRSGSASGPRVKSRKQAIAIAMSEAGQTRKKKR